MGWKRNIIKYGFKTKNREELFKRFSENKLTMPEAVELNEKGELSGEDYDEFLKIIVERHGQFDL